MATVRAGPGAPGLAIRCRPVSARGVVHKRVPVARAQDENPFAKLGSQLVQAGSRFTETFTGTTRIARQNVVKDDVVFVAGASGRVGSRIVKECAKAGYTVRAGVRSREKGQDLIQSIRDEDELTPQQIRKIRVEDFDLFEPDTIAPAIGNAACVISSIGAPEDKPFDQTGPRRIDGEAAITLVKEAAKQNVKRFMMVSSLGTTKFGLPASLLNLFWGVLYWKQQAENELIRSGMLYTIVRPGGMERPTDSYKDTHNTVMYARDKMFSGEISRLQVAEVVAACVANEDKSANKTLEVIASNVAPPRTLEEMLVEQPVEITVEELREKQAEIADVRNRADGFSREAEELEAKLAEAEETKLKAEEAFSSARATLQEVKAETADVMKASSEVERTVQQLQSQRDQAALQESAAKAVLEAQRTAQRELRLLSAQEIREVADAVLNPPAPAAVAAGAGAGAAVGGAPKMANPFDSLFGGNKAKEAVEEAPAEEEQAPAAKAKAARKPAPKAAAAKKEPPAEQQEETVQVKGGGLFGFFQQDTVFADEAEESVPPSTELVERAVTKKGTGRQSVKELISRKGDDKPAAAAAAAAAPAAAKKPPTPPPKPTPKPVAKKAAPADKELAAKREAAVAAALNNLGTAAKKVEAEAKPANNSTNGSAPAAAKEEAQAAKPKAAAPAAKPKAAAPAAKPKAAAPAAEPKAAAAPAVPAAPAATAEAELSFASDKAGAQAWIKNWKSKQQKPAFSFKMPW